MGNSSASGMAAIILVDKPFVPDQDFAEDLEVHLNVKGERVVLSEWPAQAFAVPPPTRGMLFASVWAVNVDDDDDRREVGQLLIPHTSLESFEESGFSLWLGLLDPAMVPSTMYPFQEEAERCFADSLAASKDPGQAKVCFTVAALHPDLLQSPSLQQDIQVFQRTLNMQPTMRLLGHANDLIRSLTKFHIKSQKELRAAHREFRSKETIFHSFVHVEKKKKEEDKERFVAMTRQRVAKWAKLFNETLPVKNCFNSWCEVLKTSKLHKLEDALKAAKRNALSMMESFLGRDMTDQDELKKRIFDSWQVMARKMRLTEQTFVRLNPPTSEIAREIAFLAWRHVMMQENRDDPAKVGVFFTLRNLDKIRLNHSVDELNKFVVNLKEALLIDVDRLRLSETNIRVFLPHDTLPNSLPVIMRIKVSSSTASAFEVKSAFDERHASGKLAADMHQRLITNPKILAMCTGPFMIQDLAIKYIRGKAVQAQRDQLAELMNRLISLFLDSERFLLQDLLILAWYTAINHDKEKRDRIAMQVSMIDRYLQGESMELFSSIVTQWQAHLHHAKLNGWHSERMEKYRQEMENFLSDEATRWEGQLKDQKTEHDREVERKHAVIEGALLSWAEGEFRGCKDQIFSSWRNFSVHAKELARRRQDVHDALLKSFEGDARATEQIVFTNWAVETTHRRMQRVQEEALERAQQEYMDYITDEKARFEGELKDQKTEFDKEMERKRAAIEFAVLSWGQGESNAAMYQTFHWWRRFTELSTERARRRQDVHDAFLRCFEGENEATLQLTFSNWASDYKHCKQERYREAILEKTKEEFKDFISDEKARFEGDLKDLKSEHDRAIERKHATIEFALISWEKGDSDASLCQVYHWWRKFSEIASEQARRRQDVHDALLRFVESEECAAVQLTFTNWASEYKHAKAERLQRAAEERAQQEYLDYITDEKVRFEGKLKDQKTEHDREIERKRATIEYALFSWEQGDSKASLNQVFHWWRKFVELASEQARRRQDVHDALLRCFEGEDFAAVQFTFANWASDVKHAKLEKLKQEEEKKTRQEYEDFISDERARFEGKLDDQMSEYEKAMQRKKATIEYALMSWGEGEKKAAIDQVFHWWRKHVLLAAEQARRRQDVHDALLRFAESEDRAAVQLTFTNWKSYYKHSRTERLATYTMEQERKNFDVFVDEQTTRHGNELTRVMTAAEIRQEAAHEATRQMMLKWSLGDMKGLSASIIYEWKRYVEILRDLERRHEAAKLACMSWLEGHSRGLRHLCFVHWVHYREQERLHRYKNDMQQQVEALLKDHRAKLDAKEEEQRNLKELHHNTVNYCLLQWEEGAERGSLDIVFHCWQHRAHMKAEKARKREAVNAAILEVLEGAGRACVHHCFGSWKHDAHVAFRTRRQDQEKRNLEEFATEIRTRHGQELDRHLSAAALRRERAHEATRLMMEKWMLGDAKGLMASVFYEWKRYVADMRELERRHEDAKMAAMKFLEGESAALVHLSFKHWVHYTQQERSHRHYGDMKQQLDNLFDEHTRMLDDHEDHKKKIHQMRRNGVHYCLCQWEEGERMGALRTVWKSWRHSAHLTAERGRRIESVHICLLQALEGHNRADVQAAFADWKHETKVAVSERRDHEEKRRFDEFVEEQRTNHGKELDRHLTKVQIHKEQTHEATLMMLRKWCAGENKGLLATMVYEWKRKVSIERTLERRHEASKMAAMRWVEGGKRGLVHLNFVHWVHFWQKERLHRNHDKDMKQQLDDMFDEHSRKIDAHQDEKKRIHELRHNSIQYVLKQWEEGHDRGSKDMVFRTWRHVCHIAAQKDRKTEAVHACILEILEGDDRGIVHCTFANWKHDAMVAMHDRREQEEKRKLQEFLEEQTRIHGRELERQLTAAQLRKESAHEATKLMMARWARGDRKGYLSTMVGEWRRYVDIQRDLERRHEAAKLAVFRWVEGGERGTVHVCFKHWVHFTVHELIQRERSGEIEQAREKYDQMVSEIKDIHGKELDRHLTAAELRRERAHEATNMMLQKWSRGNAKGLTVSVLYEWKRFVKIMRDLERRHESAKASAMSFLEGRGRAAVHICFVHLVHFCKQENLHRKHAHLKHDLDALYDDKLRKAAERRKRFEATQLSIEFSMRKWMRAPTAVLAEVLNAWLKYSVRRTTQREGKEEVKATVYKWIEGDKRGLLQVTLSDWRHQVESRMKDRQAQLTLEKVNSEWQAVADLEKIVHAKIGALQVQMRELLRRKAELESRPSEEQEYLKKSLLRELESFEVELREQSRLLDPRLAELSTDCRDLVDLEEEARRMIEYLSTVTIAQKIEAILRDWHDHGGHLQVLVRSLFTQIDADRDGRLEWNNNEIRTFVHELFHRQGVPFPPWQEHVFYNMYRTSDINHSYSLELDESARFARTCFEAALALERYGPENPGDLIGGEEVVHVNAVPRRNHAPGPVPAPRSAMTYSSGVVVDFLESAKNYSSVISVNQSHRVRMLRVIESGEHLKATMKTYRECDKDGNGRLTWNNGEIRDFIATCFLQHGLTPPSEEQTYFMYNQFDKDRNHVLDMRECLELVDALFRCTFVIEEYAQPVIEYTQPLMATQQGVRFTAARSASPVPMAPVITKVSHSPSRTSLNVQSITSHGSHSPSNRATLSPAAKEAFDTVDANHDGIITRQEFDNAIAQNLIAEISHVTNSQSQSSRSAYPGMPQPPAIPAGELRAGRVLSPGRAAHRVLSPSASIVLPTQNNAQRTFSPQSSLVVPVPYPVPTVGYSHGMVASPGSGHLSPSNSDSQLNSHIPAADRLAQSGSLQMHMIQQQPVSPKTGHRSARGGAVPGYTAVAVDPGQAAGSMRIPKTLSSLGPVLGRMRPKGRVIDRIHS